MTKYTLEQIQHMAAIQTPLPAAYYDAMEIEALLAEGVEGGDPDPATPEGKILDLLTRVYWMKGNHKHASALLAAALEQARREGAAGEYRRGVEAMLPLRHTARQTD